MVASRASLAMDDVDDIQGLVCQPQISCRCSTMLYSLQRLAQVRICRVRDGWKLKRDPSVPEDLLRKLQFFFPDSLILAALDLIDRDCGMQQTAILWFSERNAVSVILYTSPMGRTHLQVTGSTSRYSVRFLEEGTWCDCPAFTFSVLLSQTHYMVKHQ